jgi:hypothetical protein
MKHIDNFDNFSIVEKFDKLGDFWSRTKKNISKNVSGLVNKNKEDVDLATEILEHLKKMPLDYNFTGEYNLRNVNKLSNNYFSIVDNRIFKNSQDKYKVDFIKHIDFKTNSTPEYTISITKAKANHSTFSLRTYDGGRKQKDDYNNSPSFDKQNSQRLIIPQRLAKEIYELAESINKQTAKNVKDDARGPRPQQNP